MKKNQYVKETLISAEQIQERVAQMGEEITRDFQGKNLLVVGILKGAWIFLADLARKIDLDVQFNFISASSYGSGTETSGDVKILRDLTADCRGKDVLIVEDIIDSGLTLKYLQDVLLSRKAKSVSVAVLLSKPARRKADIDVQYVGFEIPDKFVIGYGMDYAERFRNLEEVGVLKEEVYS